MPRTSALKHNPDSRPDPQTIPGQQILRQVALANLAEPLGSLGLGVFAFTAWLSPPLMWFGLGLCAFAMLLSPEGQAFLRRDPALRVASVVSAFIVLEIFRGIMLLPESAERQWTDGAKWALLMSFPVIAWWFGGDRDRIGRVMILSLMGLHLGMLPFLTGDDILTFRAEHQTGLQLTAPTSGLIAATALLGLLVFSDRFFCASKRWIPLLMRRAFWFLSLYLMAYRVVASQSRISWVSMVIVLFAFMGYRYVRGTEPRTPRRPRYLVLLALLLVFGGLAINAEKIISRIGPDQQSMAGILMGKTKDLPESSFKYRYHVQVFGLEKWLEKPFLGWGAGSTRSLLARESRPELFNRTSNSKMGHLHNGYLEVLLRFGLVGAAIAIFLARKLGGNLVSARRTGRLPADYFLFLVGSLVLTAIWTTANFGLTTDHWQHWLPYWLLLMGISYRFGLGFDELEPVSSANNSLQTGRPA